MTASSLPGEGKSLTAVNLALTLSESYHRRVLLIDADLRRPTVQRIFGLPTINGLDDGLKAEHDRPMPSSSVGSAVRAAGGAARSRSAERPDVRAHARLVAAGARARSTG